MDRKRSYRRTNPLITNYTFSIRAAIYASSTWDQKTFLIQLEIAQNKAQKKTLLRWLT